MREIRLIATCTFGLESVVAQELKELGYKKVEVSNGKVEFGSTVEDICISNIKLRCAERVFLKLGSFKATTFDELFEKTRKLPWEELLPKKAKFPVSKVSSVKSKLFSKSDCQRIVKKAIVEKLTSAYGISYFQENGPEYPVKIELNKDIAVLSVDTSGSGLHKRGYRSNEIAPIKETLAAGLVKLSRYTGERVLLDPMCGSGTILIEAAMIARNIAPGGNRYFISEKWPLINEKTWIEQRDKAYSQENHDKECKILGSDINGRTLKTARENISRAGVDDCVFVQKLPLNEISSKYEFGAIITNPPYGQRLSDQNKVKHLYKEMGRIFQKNFATWSYYVITPDGEFPELFGRKATKNRKLYNGGIKCYYFQYYGPKRKS